MSRWRKGPPPSVGWWPASVNRNHHLLRWWNGEYWSAAVAACESAEYAAAYALIRASYHMHKIEWTDRPDDWPERSKT